MASATSSLRSAMPYWSVCIFQSCGRARVAGNGYGRRPSCAPTARPEPGSSAPRGGRCQGRGLLLRRTSTPAVLTATIATYPEARQLDPACRDNAPGVCRDPRHLPACRAHHPAARLRRRRRSAASLRIRDHGRHVLTCWIGVGSTGHRMSRHLWRRAYVLVVADAASTVQAPRRHARRQKQRRSGQPRRYHHPVAPDGSVGEAVARNWRQPHLRRVKTVIDTDHRHQGRRSGQRHPHRGRP